MSVINYRQGSEVCRKAWFEYKNSVPGLHSVVEFAAGFNAALASISKIPGILEELEKAEARMVFEEKVGSVDDCSTI